MSATLGSLSVLWGGFLVYYACTLEGFNPWISGTGGAFIGAGIFFITMRGRDR